MRSNLQICLRFGLTLAVLWLTACNSTATTRAATPTAIVTPTVAPITTPAATQTLVPTLVPTAPSPTNVPHTTISVGHIPIGIYF